MKNFNKFYYKVEENSELSQQVEKILTLFEDVIDSLNIQNKLAILSLMRNSGIYNHKILDFMLYYTEMNFDNLSYEDLLNIVRTNNGARKISPFEIFFRLRNRFNEQYDEFKSTVIITTLGVFCKARMMYSESLYENAFKCVQKEGFIESLRPLEAVLVLNYYSKTRYRDQQLFDSLFTKVLDNIKGLNKLYMKILLLTLADLNYPNKEVYMKLYQSFTASMIAEEKFDDDSLPEIEEEDYMQVIQDFIGVTPPDHIQQNPEIPLNNTS